MDEGTQETPGAHGTPEAPGGLEALGAPGVGDVVAGVRLTSWLGQGAAGTVWAGTDVGTGERLAVKVLHRGGAGPGAGAAPGDGGRWREEAALLEQVRDPHVLRLRRVAEDPPALVTELAVGGSVAAQVAARGPWEAGEVVTVLVPLAEALARLHERGVVHGDVSGGNVLFVDHGRPVLADLGGARLAGDGLVVATPGYAAPEVLAGGAPGPAADVHGLAAVAWLALTGAAPPEEADRLPLRLLAPECPDGLVDVVTAGLAADPAGRPAAVDLAREARAAAPARPVRLVPSAARGIDEAEAVTYRVREAAAVAAEERVWRLRDRAAALWRRLPRRAVLATGGAIAGLAVAAVVLALAPSVLTGEPAGRSGAPVAGPPALRPDGPPATTAPTPAGPITTAPEPPPATSVSSAGADRGPDLEGRVREVVSRREAALRTGDLAALDHVHAAGTAAREADEELLADGPVPVRYDVVSVLPVPGRTDAAVLEVLTRHDGGDPVRERVRLELVPAGEVWLLADVLAGR